MNLCELLFAFFDELPKKTIKSARPKAHPDTMKKVPQAQSTRKKFPASYAAFIMPLCLTCMMTCVVSCISTLNSVGFIDGFLRIWLKAWGFSWLVAFPVMKFLLPIVQRFTQFLVESPHQKTTD